MVAYLLRSYNDNRVGQSPHELHCGASNHKLHASANFFPSFPFTLTFEVPHLRVPAGEPQLSRGVFKLGITGDLPVRLASLNLSFGPCDPVASVLIRTRTMRAALRLEQFLQTAFDASKWRATAPLTTGEGRSGNGHTEWYRREALEEMLLLVAGLIVRDAEAGLERFVIERNLTEILRREEPAALLPAQRGGQSRRHARAEADGQARWEKSEASFQRLQEFIEARRDRVRSVGRPRIDSQGWLRRTFTFQARPDLEMEGERSGSDEWDELFSFCTLFYRTHRGYQLLEHGGINYLQRCRYLAEL